MSYTRLITLATCFATLPILAQKPCTVKGSLSSDLKSEKIYVYLSNASLSIGTGGTDSVLVMDGKFTYTCPSNELRQALFVPVLDGGKSLSMNQMQMMLVPDEQAEVVIGKNENDNTISGSKFYKEWTGAEKARQDADMKVRTFAMEASARLKELGGEERQRELAKAQAELDERNKARDKEMADYAKAHATEEGCALFCVLHMTPSYLYYDLLAESVKQGRFGEMLKKQAEGDRQRVAQQADSKAKAQVAQSKTKAGMMFVDFSAEYDGKVQKLSDHVGKGKYVLVDFWASWCGPCKAEIPGLIEVYNKYKGDKFEVLGVATWDKPEDTLKALEQLKIPYPQIMNAQYAGSDAYGIEGIPQIILFAPDGKIVARDLRGASIEAKVKEVLGK